MTNIFKSFCKTDPNLIANLAMVCKVTSKEDKRTMTNYFELQMFAFNKWMFIEKCDTLDGVQSLAKAGKRHRPDKKFRILYIEEIEVLND